MVTKPEVENLYQRIANARSYVLNLSIKKEGTIKANSKSGQTYVKSRYFTPEQVETIATQASLQAGIEVFFDLLQDEYGYYGQLIITNVDDPSDQLIQVQRTDLPSIINANKAQQFGGMRTYTERYMLQSFFRINTEKVDIDSIPMNQKPTKSSFLSSTELNKLHDLVVRNKLENELVVKIINNHGFKKSSEITQDKYRLIYEQIESLIEK